MSIPVGFKGVRNDCKKVLSFVKQAEKLENSLRTLATSGHKVQQTSKDILKNSLKANTSRPLTGRIRRTSPRKGAKTKFHSGLKLPKTREANLKGQLVKISAKIKAEKGALEKSLPKVAKAYAQAGVENKQKDLGRLEQLFIDLSSCLDRIDRLELSLQKGF